MVDVNGVNGIEQKIIPPNSLCAKSSSEQKVVLGLEGKSTNPPEVKKFDIRTLDFDTLPKKVKVVLSGMAGSISPMQEATELIQTLDKSIQKHNENYPSTPLSIDFSGFPDPKNFDKGMCNKKQAYYEWKDALSHWYEMEVERLDNASEKTQEEYFNKILENQKVLEERLDRNFYHDYIQAGTTREQIKALAKAVNYDLDKLETSLKKEFAKTNANIKNTGNRIVYELEDVVRSEHDKTRKENDSNSRVVMAATGATESFDYQMHTEKTMEALGGLRNLITNSNLPNNKKVDLFNELSKLGYTKDNISETDINNFREKIEKAEEDWNCKEEANSLPEAEGGIIDNNVGWSGFLNAKKQDPLEYLLNPLNNPSN